MKHVRIYDNQGETLDRYTAVYLDQPERNGLFACLGLSNDPFNPLGYCEHSTAQLGRHLGKRVSFASLPADVQQAIRQDRA